MGSTDRSRQAVLPIAEQESGRAPKPGKQFYFTIDCDWVPGSHVGLESLLERCDRFRIKATIFFAGRFAETYPDLVRECLHRGHQLGTHGWAHGALEEDEDFRNASYEQQRQWIRRATDAVEKAAGIRPVVFRSPNLWIGETTLRVLEEEGYRCDSSVPARRFDMGFGRVHYLTYFGAPRDPYRPSRNNLNRPGDSSIVEVPPSSCLFPINLATLRTLGLPTFQRMIRWIGQRSRHLVFYCHPGEFVPAAKQTFPPSMSKWNRRGMGPNNLLLVENLLAHIHAAGYVATRMTDTATRQLDLTQPVVLRARGLQSEPIYREERQR
ncbi:MAG: polysaccharide deacetylase family protein [Nitrospira sp.]|nr:polysaccharide deacetylase family protein [Nitrospira sp.]